MFSKTKADSICKALEDDIVRGKLPHGAPLEELVLAERFECSRTPVREALHKLVALEHAERRPHHGVVVNIMSQERIIIYFEAIAEMEALCTRLCIERSSAAERLEFSEFYERMSECAERGDPIEYAEFNTEFHKMILTGAKNDVLGAMSLQAQRRLSPYRYAQFEDIERLNQSHAEHGLIVQAIGKRDVNSGYKIMYDHIIAAQDMVLKRIRTQSRKNK